LAHFWGEMRSIPIDWAWPGAAIRKNRGEKKVFPRHERGLSREDEYECLSRIVVLVFFPELSFDVLGSFQLFKSWMTASGFVDDRWRTTTASMGNC
jgi:hypothetical protein